jgi:hypothetical protein
VSLASPVQVELNILNKMVVPAQISAKKNGHGVILIKQNFIKRKSQRKLQINVVFVITTKPFNTFFLSVTMGRDPPEKN